MPYLTPRPCTFKAAHGSTVTLESGQTFPTIGNWIATEDGKALCLTTSENAHQYFSRNDDGCGMERGRLTRAIMDELSSQNQEVWNRVWEDALCQKYKRTDHEDYWLWNHDFYNAPIEDLRYIARLVGVKEVNALCTKS